MLKKSKYIFGAILSLLVLGGCREEMPSLGEASSTETSSETVTETSAATTAVPAEEETSTATSETTETTAEHDDISEEQAALEKLILDNAENKEGYTIQSPLFGDFDGDGVNELIALYGEIADTSGCFPKTPQNELWFSSGNTAKKIGEAGDWFPPEIVTICGNALIKTENYTLGEGSKSYFFLIKESTASRYYAIPLWCDVEPVGNFGDISAAVYTDDYALVYTDKKSEGTLTGTADKTYWYYLMNGGCREYYGREITKEEFLKYEDAEFILDGLMTAYGYEAKSIVKRGNGIININFAATNEHDGNKVESYRHICVKYRNGRIYEILYAPHCGRGNYLPDEHEQTDFERFSEMIYDTAEGDENSFIRERFYGDTDKDGKNELYAYYGTDENFLLWFADENGAKKVTDDIRLFYADGDVLMKNGDDYFVMKNGKSKKLDTLGVEDFTVQEDGSFTGYISSGYADSTRSDVIKQLYWFRYKDGKISEYAGLDITEEELLQYGGGRAFLDEIAARGGDLVNIVRRENGIININYALHNQTITNRFFMTLEIGADNKLTDITPKHEDGTSDNVGWYLHSLSIASAK